MTRVRVSPDPSKRRVSSAEARNRSRAFLSSTGSPEFKIGSIRGPKISTRPGILSDFKSSITVFNTSSGEAKLLCLPSRPGEFHPEPLTDPDLTLSRHPARATARRLPPAIEIGFLPLPVDPRQW